LYAILTVHLYGDRSTYGLADVVVGSLAGINSMQVASLQLGDYQLVMLHFGWVGILIVRVVHQHSITPPSDSRQRPT
jgi:hypothetical protein